ncbi:MAG: ATP-binding cassette domain-containing protein [Patescibacteria group bacterium]
MSENEVIVRFSNVSFNFEYNKPILDDVSFSMRKGMKMALMGQNGAGKSTIFKLMTKAIQPESGNISVDNSLKVATAHQVISLEDREVTIEAFFQKYSGLEAHDLKRKISDALTIVNLHAPLEKVVRDFSGGQQARLLLAAALIQNPDLLLLDEPTNNLDPAGIEHLTHFLVNYKKSCLVISHDADFLNAFTEGVFYLDTFTHKIEQYTGNYYSVVEEISVRIEKENQLNARKAKGIQENKEKANFFAHKGGKMRLVAKKMRERAELLESEKVDVRKEDKTIRKFTIPAQRDIMSPIVKISSFSVMKNHQTVTKKTNIFVGKNDHLLISGPNGIGKSTLIESLATGTAEGATISSGVTVGYYRQDFSTLNFDDTVRESLVKALTGSGGLTHEEELRSVASGFLINSDLIKSRIGNLSEGQKGLVSFARLVLQKPGLLILDEPTNHINFRHLPIIAQALDKYEGAMILVSHVPEFVWQIRIDQELDLEK